MYIAFLQSQYFVPFMSFAVSSFVWVISWIGLSGTVQYFPKGFGNNVWAIVRPYMRSIVYAGSLLWATVLFMYAAQTTGPSAAVSLSVLMRQFALTGLYLLFLTLVPGLLSIYFPTLPFNALLVRARRAMGLSGFYFGAAHGLIGFIYNLSANILSPLFLAPRYQLALLCSATAFIILALLAFTSIDRVEHWLGPIKWKRLHRYIYWAVILIVIHAFLIGSHFTSPAAFIPKLTNCIALTLLILEAGATALRLWQQKRLSTIQGQQIGILLIVLILSGFWSTITIFQKPYDPHAAHRKGYSKNYIAEVTTDPKVLLPNQPITAHIVVRDKRNGQIVKKFQLVQEKYMHLIIIGRDLMTYQHIHPDLNSDGTFTVAFTLPKEGTYTMYIEYSPPDFLENLSMVTIHTQNAPSDERAHLGLDDRTKVVGSTTVSLSPKDPVPLTDTVDFSYVLTESAFGKPVTDIQSYLAAFGHLAIVSEDGQIYTHVHPIDVPLTPDQLGGPRVRFSTFFQKKGMYKLFGQFKRNDEVFVTEFIVEVK